MGFSGGGGLMDLLTSGLDTWTPGDVGLYYLRTNCTQAQLRIVLLFTSGLAGLILVWLVWRNSNGGALEAWLLWLDTWTPGKMGSCICQG